MQFSTQQKSYTDSQQGTIAGSGTRISDKFSSPSYQLPSKRQGTDNKRPNMLESAKNDELFEAFPQLTIHRVDSSQHREKLKNQPLSGNIYMNMTSSLIQKPVSRGDSKLTSTSVQKPTGAIYTNPRQTSSYNQLQTNKATYKLNYATYKKEGNALSPNYAYGVNSQDGSENEVPVYKRINNVMTMEKMDMEISPKMVSSVISRGSSGKQLSEERYNQRVYLSTTDNNRGGSNKGQEDAYDMYASRHPNQSIRKSTIQISKAISSNAITQLQKQNENQEKKIKKLQKQLEQFKDSLKKWDQIKHRYQLDLQSKSRQIFDLERVNKRLSEQAKGIMAYRTMDTVEQVIIVRLKEQIMQLNKKIISMQADHYKNQKMLIQKQKKDGTTGISTSQAEQTNKKLQQQLLINKKESQLLGVQLQKQKQKSWTLQKQKQQYLAQKNINKQSYEQQLNASRKQISSLKHQIQKNLQIFKSKDIILSQKLQQQKKIFENEISVKLAKKQQQYRTDLSQKLAKKQQQFRNKLNQQMRLYESKIVQKGKTQKLQQQQQRKILQNLRAQKQQSQNILKQKISQFQQNLKLTNMKLVQKQQSINNDFVKQIQNLKRIVNENENYIRDIQNQNQNIKVAIQERENEIGYLKADNIKFIEDLNRQVNQKAIWKQQQASAIQNAIRVKFQADFKQKEKQLEVKAQNISNLEQNIKQMKLKLQQDQQQQVVKAQNQARQKEQQSIKDLEVTKLKLTEQVKKAEANLSNINKQLTTLSGRKTQIQSDFNIKQKQAKDAQQKYVQLQAKVQSKTTQLTQLQNQKKLLAVETERVKQNQQKQKVLSKQLQTKYNTLNNQFNSYKIQYAKLEQKSKQLQVQFNRVSQTNNTWKSKSENLQSTTEKLKKDLASAEKDREQFKAKFIQAQAHRGRPQIVKKYQQLLPEYEIIKQKLLLKQQQITNRQSAFLKARQQVQSIQSRSNALLKQIKNLTTKVTDTQTKLGTLLTKAQADQHKYKQLFLKMVNDAKVYMAFIKKLQQDNQLVVQKYWKIRKLVKKQKINDDNDLLQKHDYGTFKQYIEQEIASQFKRMIIPAFQSKIVQRISACETNIANKYKKLAIVKALVEQVKRKRQAQKAKLKAK